MTKFRNDINLLRALAIIFVVLFHYKIPFINNGFIGVDIFFVISGYLMTSIIFNGLNSNTFSYFRFMKARFKRIVPALLLLVIALWIFSYFQVFNFVYQRVVKEIAYAVEFFSNVKYYREVGYFDIGAQRKWLLHTWSLAVEFQFYLIYPIALIVLKKIFNLKVLKWFILFTFICSLSSSIYFSYIDPSASYYLLYNRAWQLLAGALVFLFPLKISKTNLVQYLTVILLTAFLFLPSFENSWGGFISLVPIVLAMLFLYSNSNDTMLSKNLVLKYLGLWSYSIYLWHWVIYAGLNYYQLSSNSYYMLGGIVISVLLGATSYYTIERNFRYKITITFIVFVAVIFASNYVHTKKISNGNNININFKRYNTAVSFYNKKSKLFFVGDSHMQVSLPVIYKLSKKYKIEPSIIVHGGCIPILNIEYNINKGRNFNKMCKPFNIFFEKVLKSYNLKNKTLIMVQRFRGYIGTKATKHSKKELLNIIDNKLPILNKKFKKVIIVLDVPQQKYLPSIIYKRSIRYNKIDKNLLYKNSISLKEYKEQQREVNSFIRRVASKYKNVIVLDPTPYVCDKFRCPVGTDKVSYYSDGHHLTVNGALRLLPLFKPYFKGE